MALIQSYKGVSEPGSGKSQVSGQERQVLEKGTSLDIQHLGPSNFCKFIATLSSALSFFFVKPFSEFAFLIFFEASLFFPSLKLFRTSASEIDLSSLRPP